MILNSKLTKPHVGAQILYITNKISSEANLHKTPLPE